MKQLFYYCLVSGFFIFLIRGIFSTASAQTPSYMEYTTREGLAQNQVTDIFQDSRGYIWIGTKAGLSRFDGLEFRNFYLSDGLPENHICAIAESPNGTLYVLTRSGVAMSSGDAFQPFPHPDGSIFQYWSTIFGYNRITPLHDGWLFIAASEHPPLVFKNGIYYPADTLFPGMENVVLNSHFISDDQTRSLMTSMFHMNLTLYEKNNPAKLSLLKREVGYLVLSQGEKIAYHTADSVYLFDKNTLELTDSFDLNYNTYGLLSLYISRDEFYTLKDNSTLLAFIDGQIQEYRFQMPYINKVFKDREENIWLVGEGRALKLISWQFMNVSGLPGAPLYPWTVIEEPGNGLWVGGYGDGLFFFDGNSFEKIPVDDIPKDGAEDYFYMGSTRDRHGNIWMPHGKGVVKIENGRARLLSNAPQTYTLGAHEHPENKSMILIHTDSFTVIDTLGSIKTYPLMPGNRSGLLVKAMTDKNGKTWIGSIQGISLWDGNNITHLPTREIPFGEGAVSMARDHKGNMWLGNAKGIYFYDYNGKVSRIAQNTINNPVKDLQAIDSTGLYIGMIGKIAFLDLDRFYRYGSDVVTIYDESTGFMGLEVQQNGSNVGSDGSVWISTHKSIVQFRPHQTNPFSLNPRQAIISGISWLSPDNKWNRLEENILSSNQSSAVFTHRQNNLRFDFKGITMVKPHHVKYRYKIDGLDTQWSEGISDRYVSYTYLPAGSYTFLVDMTMHNGQWSEMPVSFRFIIKQAWWETLAFRLFVLIFVITLTAWGIQKISSARRKIKWKRLENEKRIAELRLEALGAQTEPHFLFNVLNSLAMHVIKGEKDEAYSLLIRFSRLIRRVFEKKSSYYSPLEEEIKLTQDYLYLQKQRFKDAFDFSIEVDESAEFNTGLPRMFLQSLAENAIKHGVLPADTPKHITIKVKKEDRYVIVNVEDNGVGRMNSQNNKNGSTGRGLQIAKELFGILNHYNTEKIRFEIEDLFDENGSACGTRVNVAIPEGFRFDVLSPCSSKGLQ